MIKIFEVEQEFDRMENFQSRIIEFESFQEYLDYIQGLPIKEDIEVFKKHINYEQQVVTFMFERKVNEKWVEYTHFGQVIG